MKTNSPLGRDSMQFTERMKKYHAEIERLVYAAEILCHENKGGDPRCQLGTDCLFWVWQGCWLDNIRTAVGDHIIQHDIEVPR
jgi:hypothetical protein